MNDRSPNGSNRPLAMIDQLYDPKNIRWNTNVPRDLVEALAQVHWMITTYPRAYGCLKEWYNAQIELYAAVGGYRSQQTTDAIIGGDRYQQISFEAQHSPKTLEDVKNKRRRQSP